MLPDQLSNHSGLARSGRPLEHTEVACVDALEDGFLLGVVELQDRGPVEVLEFRGIFDGGVLITEHRFGLGCVENELPDLLVDRSVVRTLDGGTGPELGDGILKPVEFRTVPDKVRMHGVDLAAMEFPELQEEVGLLDVVLVHVREIEHQVLGCRLVAVELTHVDTLFPVTAILIFVGEFIDEIHAVELLEFFEEDLLLCLFRRKVDLYLELEIIIPRGLHNLELLDGFQPGDGFLQIFLRFEVKGDEPAAFSRRRVEIIIEGVYVSPDIVPLFLGKSFRDRLAVRTEAELDLPVDVFRSVDVFQGVLKECEAAEHVLADTHLNDERVGTGRFRKADLLLVVLQAGSLEGTVLGEGDAVFLHMRGFPKVLDIRDVEEDTHGDRGVPFFTHSGGKGLKRNRQFGGGNVGPPLGELREASELRGDPVGSRNGPYEDDASDAGLPYIAFRETLGYDGVYSPVDVVKTKDSVAVVVDIRLDGELFIERIFQRIVFVRILRRKAQV